MVDEPAPPQTSITKRKAPPGTDFFRAIFERSSNSRQRTGTAFERDVSLAHPIDITVPVESRMGLGILEFRFQKGLQFSEDP